MKIYFGIGGQYGDIFMGEPALRKLLKIHPKAEFVFGCSERYGDVLPLFYDYHPRIIDYRVWEAYPPHPKFFTPADKKYIQKMSFDIHFTHERDHSGQWANRWHQVVEQGKMAGIDIEDSKIRLKRPASVGNRIRTVAISLFPAGGEGVKDIGTERARRITSYIHSLGYEVLHLNGPGEPDIEGAEKVNLTYSDAVIAMLGTDLLITGDTGMSWAASAYDHPVVGLCAIGYYSYCETSVNWQPVNPNAVYLEGRRASNIPPDDIFDAISSKLKAG